MTVARLNNASKSFVGRALPGPAGKDCGGRSLGHALAASFIS